MTQFFKSYFTQSEFKRFNKKIETYIFIFKQQGFEQKDIPELIKDVWTYSDNHGKKCYVCSRYREWAIEALRTKWKKDYVDIEMVSHCLYIRKTHWLKNTMISRKHKQYIYSFLNN